jgi:hypothetical protein
MSTFVPRGFKRIVDVGQELGHDELRQQLVSGQRAAFFWDQQDAKKPLRQIPQEQWLAVKADRIIRGERVTWAPYPLAPKWKERALMVLVADVKSNVARTAKGGRPHAADWSAIEELIRLEVERHGLPESGLKGWQNQSDVERWVAEQLEHRGESAGESTIRDHVRKILKRLRPET